MAESSDKMEVDVSSAAAAAAVPSVPETLLKKRKRDEQWASTRKQQLEISRSKNVKNRQLIFKRAEQYIKEYRSQVRENLIFSRVAIFFLFLFSCIASS
jgi:large subunit ribosomal protein L7e